MTAYSKISRGQPRTDANIKDGHQRRPRSLGDEYERAGFEFVAPMAKYTYTTEAGIVFRVAPDTIIVDQEVCMGMIARCETPTIVEWFPYGTDPQDIKARLEAEITKIFKPEAWEDWIEIDIDAWMKA